MTVFIEAQLQEVNRLIPEFLAEQQTRYVQPATPVEREPAGREEEPSAGFSLGRAIINALSSIVSRGTESVKQFFGSAFDGLKRTIQGLLANIGSAVKETIKSAAYHAGEAVETVIGFVSENLEPVLRGIKDLIGGITDDIYEFIKGGITSIRNIVTDVRLYVKDLIVTVRDEVRTIFNKFNDWVKEVIALVQEEAKQLFTETKRAIEEINLHTKEDIKESFRKFTGHVQDLMSEVKTSVSETLDVFLPYAESVTKSLGELFTKMDDDLIPNLAAIALSVMSTFGIVDTEENRKEVKEASEVLVNRFDDLINPEKSLIESLVGLGEYDPSGGILSGVANFFVGLVSVALHTPDALRILNTPKAREGLQTVNSAYPNDILSPHDAAGLTARRLLGENEGEQIAKKGGIDETNFNLLKKGSEAHLDVEKGYDAFNRELIGEQDFEEILDRNAIRDSDRPVFRALRFKRPGVQDLITMAVRETFSEHFVSEYKLLSDLPDEFVREASKSGLPEEWAKKYWAAHWRLPSITQGFEMFHRAVITEKQLRDLLRAADVMPGWREHLIAISYNPITRVDIRRLYKLGLFTREDVVKRHKDIGYSPEDAEVMADFVETYTKIDEEEDEIDYRQLTFTQIKRFWTLGTITRENTVKRLIESGFSPDDAETLVLSWENADIIAYRESLLNRYLRRAIREDLSEHDARLLVNELNPTTEELDRFLTVLEIERSEFDAIPSKAELRAMYRDRIINKEQWFNTMRKHGYSVEWIENYFKLYKLG